MKKIINLLVLIALVCVFTLGVKTEITFSESIEEKFNDAITLIEGEELQGELSSSDDVDRYIFIPRETAKYIIESKGDLNINARIYDENFTQIKWASYGGDGDNFLLDIRLEKGKKYYISLEAWRRGGKYSVIAEKLPKVKINGEIKLPEGETAPSGGLEIEIKATGDNNVYNQVIFMNEGELKAEYSFEVDAYEEYEIGYIINTNIDDENYFNEGYIGEDGSVRNSFHGKEFEVKKEDIQANIDIIQAAFLSGAISLEDREEVNEKNIKLTVIAYKRNGHYLKRREASREVLIVDKHKSTIYKMKVLAKQKYYVAFETKNRDNKFPYYYKGFYKKGEVVLSLEDATEVDAKSGHISDLDLKVPCIEFIEGRIVLPNEEKTKKSFEFDIRLLERVKSEDSYDYYEREDNRLRFNQNQSFVDFTLRAEKNKEYILGYHINNYYSSIEYGSAIYKLGGSVRKRENGTTISVEKNNNKGILFEMIPERFIKGTVSLPDGLIAPKGGYWIRIETIGNREHIDDIKIEEGSSSKEYRIATGDSDQEKLEFSLLKYSAPELDGYFTYGYYSSKGAQTDIDEAENINIKETVENINFTFIPKKTISVNISLPEDKNSEDRLSGYVYLINKNGTESNKYNHKSIVIQKGMSSAKCTFTVQEGYNYIIKYDNSWTRNKRYYNIIYYNSQGPVTDENEAEVIHVDGDMEIKLALKEILGIEGEIRLPEGEVAPRGGVDVRISCAYQYSGFSYDYMIEEGKNSVKYFVKTDKNEKYRIGYTISRSYGDKKYDYEDGFYNSKGTVRNIEDATELHVGEKKLTNIDMEIIRPLYISGQVKVPEGIEIPVNGIEVYIQATETSENGKSVFQFITIDKDNPVGNFKLRVKNKKEYKLHYSLRGHRNTELHGGGFYKASGTVFSKAEGEIIRTENENIENKNITLLKSIKIKGTVSLPNGILAPTRGIVVRVQPIDSYGGIDQYDEYSKVTINGGENSASYTLKVAKGNYRFRYALEIEDNDYYSYGYHSYGYYGEDGTVIDFNEAKVLNISEDIKNINLEVVNLSYVGGVISLPEDVEAYSDDSEISMYVYRADDGAVYEVSRYDLKGGMKEFRYNIAIRNNGRYYIMYKFTDEKKGFYSSGYYSEDGVVGKISEATAISINNNKNLDINMTLKECSYISGRISLEDGKAAFKNEEFLVKLTHNDSKQKVAVKNFKINNGENYVDYFINEIPGMERNAEYSISVEADRDSRYVEKTYYGRDEMKYNISDQALIKLDGNKENIDLTVKEAKRIRGKIKLPEEMVVPAGKLIYGTIIVEDRDGAGSFVQSKKDFTIYSGQSEVDYIVKAVPNRKCSLQYSISSKADLEIVRGGYYKKDSFTGNPAKADIINIQDSDVQEVDITIEKAKYVFGRIVIPENVELSDSGAEIEITASDEDDNKYSRVVVTIPKGQTSIGYRIPVRNYMETSIGYRVLNNNENKRLKEFGYYNSAGLVDYIGDAEIIMAEDEDVDDININIPGLVKLSGVISLPDGQVAPEGGIRVCLDKYFFTDEYEWKKEKDYSYYDIFNGIATIQEGETSVEYALYGSKGSKCKISFEVQHDNYLGKSIYEVEVTEIHEEDIDNLDITIEKAICVTGKLNLPSDYNGDYKYGYVEVMDAENSRFIDSTYMYFSNGVKSKMFALKVPENMENSKIIVRYSLQKKYSKLVELGYYSEEGITTDKDSAKRFVLTKSGVEGLDLNIEYKDVQDSLVTLNAEMEYTPDLTVLVRSNKDGQEVYYEYEEYTNSPLIVEKSKNGDMWQVLVKGLNWDDNTSYKIFLSGGNVLYERELRSSDNGTTILLDESELNNVQVNLDGIESIKSINIYKTEGDEKIEFNYYLSRPGVIKLPDGEFLFKVKGKIDEDPFEYVQDNMSINGDMTVTVSRDRLAKITFEQLNLNENPLYLITALPMYSSRGEWYGEINQRRTIYLTKGNYSEVEFRVRNHLGQELNYEIEDRNIAEDRVINFDDDTRGIFELDKTSFTPNQLWKCKNQVMLKDSFGNIVYPHRNINVYLRFQKNQDVYEQKLLYTFGGYVLLPKEAGTYKMTLFGEIGGIDITSDTVEITIQENQLKLYEEAYGKQRGEDGYNEEYDHDDNGIIDIFDMIKRSKTN